MTRIAIFHVFPYHPSNTQQKWYQFTCNYMYDIDYHCKYSREVNSTDRHAWYIEGA